MDPRDPTLIAICDELKRVHGCHSAIVYGSRARGDETRASDFDVVGFTSSGPKRRDTRKINGFYLDAFIYPEAQVYSTPGLLEHIGDGVVLFEEENFATLLLAWLRANVSTSLQALERSEYEARLVWAQKMIDRARLGDAEGNYRRSWLLTALLEDYFLMRGERYLGPKQSLARLQSHAPEVYAKFEQALSAPQDTDALQALIDSVHLDLKSSGKSTDKAPGAKPLPCIETKQLVLRLALPQDIPALLRYLTANREHFAAVEPRKPDGYFEESFWQARIPKQVEAFLADQALRFCLFLGDEIVGTIEFSQIARGPFQAAYLGYAIGKKHEGKGLMFEAASAAIAYAFRDLNLHRLMANHLPENERSARLLKRLGFEREGLAKDYLQINGVWRDHVLNSLTKIVD